MPVSFEKKIRMSQDWVLNSDIISQQVLGIFDSPALSYPHKL